ncbi:MAG: hypothetical protein QOH26_447, partial [Actinomycetota bacterium]|nr:hypothetical protein [Actinomycetota bacterium]
LTYAQLTGEDEDPQDFVGASITVLLHRALGDRWLTHLGLIFDWGTTFFNMMQMTDVIPELEVLREYVEAPNELDDLQEVIRLAREVRGHPELFLVFYGD